MAKMGDFFGGFFIKTEPWTCWTSNLSPKTEPRTYQNSKNWTSNWSRFDPTLTRTLLPAKMRRAKKHFSSIYALSRKFPELNSWTPCNYMQKRPLEDAWVQKKVSALFFQQKCQERKNLLQLALYDMTEKSVHFITKISRIEHHATAIPCKRGHSKMLSAQ